MESYSLLIKPATGKEPDEVGFKADRLRINGTICDLAEKPPPQGSEKLAGYDDRCRVRPGNDRIVHAIDDSAGHVTICKIGHRKNVHR